MNWGDLKDIKDFLEIVAIVFWFGKTYGDLKSLKDAVAEVKGLVNQILLERKS